LDVAIGKELLTFTTIWKKEYIALSRTTHFRCSLLNMSSSDAVRSLESWKQNERIIQTTKAAKTTAARMMTGAEVSICVPSSPQVTHSSSLSSKK